MSKLLSIMKSIFDNKQFSKMKSENFQDIFARCLMAMVQFKSIDKLRKNKRFSKIRELANYIDIKL